MREYLFVYGSLRRGYAHPMSKWLAQHSEKLGEALVRGRLYLVSWYPGLVPGEEGKVKGDLFLLADGFDFSVLDAYEDCTGAVSDEYCRHQINVALPTGEEVLAWTYVYQLEPSGLKEIVGGDFLEV